MDIGTRFSRRLDLGWPSFSAVNKDVIDDITEATITLIAFSDQENGNHELEMLHNKLSVDRKTFNLLVRNVEVEDAQSKDG